MNKKTVLFILFGLIVGTGLKAQEDGLLEEKADFILNISRYVRWNDRDAIGNSFVIGVVRSNKMATKLEELSENRMILGKKVKIESYYRLEEIEDCQLLFLSKNVYVTTKTAQMVKDKVKSETLIISDNAETVPMINFFVRDYDHKLRFEVNVTNIQNAGLMPMRSLLKNQDSRVEEL